MFKLLKNDLNLDGEWWYILRSFLKSRFYCFIGMMVDLNENFLAYIQFDFILRDDFIPDGN